MALCFVGALVVVPLLYAKGPTQKILISGGSLVCPIEIGDAAVLKSFNIWSGTFIVANWSPVAAPPSELKRYQAAFYANHHKDGLDYIVTYVDDPANHRGFVYLPGKGEADYSLNTFSIYRGVEGQWFEARKSWVDLVTALINAKE